MKLLNLDEIALDSERTVKYKGETYKVRDFNVEEFIRFQSHFNAFRKAYDSDKPEDMQRVIEETKELTKIGVPEFPTDEVAKLNPLQMLALVSMIANLLPEPAQEAVEANAEKKENEGSLPKAE